jgi:rubrerythrin
MRGELNDLRLLKLAEMYEEAYERFVLEVAGRIVQDEEVRRPLMTLVAPTDQHHERIVAQIERLNARVGPEGQRSVERAAILDVCEVERAAHDFYVRVADQVHDPEVARLFRALAREEAGHMRIAAGALALAERKAAGAPSTFADAFRLLGEAMPLREGAIDYGSRLQRHERAGPKEE